MGERGSPVFLPVGEVGLYETGLMDLNGGLPATGSVLCGNDLGDASEFGDVGSCA